MHGPHQQGARAGAKLIVVDPRKTRTARQADKYIRIRPGTDIAFINGVTKYIIDQMEDPTSAVPAATKTNFFSFLNDASAGTFYPDEGGVAVAVAGVGKYSDARFIVKADGTDYDREVLRAATPTHHFTNFPEARCDGRCRSEHGVQPPEAARRAVRLRDRRRHLRMHRGRHHLRRQRATSRTAAVRAWATIRPIGVVGGYRAMTHLYAMGLTQHTNGAQNVKSFAVLQTLMGNMGRAGGGINALRGIHNVQGSTDMGLL